VTARGSSLIKLGWVKPEHSLSGIIRDETSANLTGTSNATLSNPEKIDGLR